MEREILDDERKNNKNGWNDNIWERIRYTQKLHHGLETEEYHVCFSQLMHTSDIQIMEQKQS